MLTRHGTFSRVVVKLSLTTLSAAFALTFASAFSFSPVTSSAAPLTAAIGITRQQVTAKPAHYVFPQNPFTAAESALHRRHLAHLAQLEKRKKAAEAALLEKRREAAAAAYAKAHPPEAQTPPTARAAARAAPSYATYSGALSSAQVGQLWLEAGGPAQDEAEAVEIAYCESGFNPRAYNPSGASGIWQILGQLVPGNVFDPLVNAENAVAKFKGAGNSFAPWVCK